MEPDIIDILINKKTKELALDIPASGLTYKVSLGEKLKLKELEEYTFAAQINIDDILRAAKLVESKK